MNGNLLSTVWPKSQLLHKAAEGLEGPQHRRTRQSASRGSLMELPDFSSQ